MRRTGRVADCEMGHSLRGKGNSAHYSAFMRVVMAGERVLCFGLISVDGTKTRIVKDQDGNCGMQCWHSRIMMERIREF